MINTTLNIPFKVCLETDSNLFGYVDHDLLRAQTYGKAAKAKEYFRKHITEEIEEGLRTAKNCRSRAIGCSNGTVFIVRYALGSWSYAICGPDKTHGGCVLIADNTFESTYEAAKRHAEQNGGIVWENSL